MYEGVFSLFVAPHGWFHNHEHQVPINEARKVLPTKFKNKMIKIAKTILNGATVNIIEGTEMCDE